MNENELDYLMAGFSSEDFVKIFKLPEQQRAQFFRERIAEKRIEQETRQKKVDESTIKTNEAQATFFEKQVESITEQREFSRIIKNSSLAMAWATGFIGHLYTKRTSVRY
jgi:hypothetical protein